MDECAQRLGEMVEELEAALYLECSENNAVMYGTEAEWRRIRKEIRRMRRRTRRSIRLLDTLGRGRGFSFTGRLLAMTAAAAVITVLELAFSFGMVNTSVFLLMCLLGKTYTLRIGSLVWLLFLILRFLLKQCCGRE